MFIKYYIVNKLWMIKVAKLQVFKAHIKTKSFAINLMKEENNKNEKDIKEE